MLITVSVVQNIKDKKRAFSKYSYNQKSHARREKENSFSALLKMGIPIAFLRYIAQRESWRDRVAFAPPEIQRGR